MNTLTPLPSDSPQVIQAVSAKGNKVAGRDLNIRTERVVRKAVVQTDPRGKHISNTVARKIQDLVKDYIDIQTTASKGTQRAAQRIWSSLKKRIQRDQLTRRFSPRIPTPQFSGLRLRSQWQDPKSAGKPLINGRRVYTSPSTRARASLGFSKTTSICWRKSDWPSRNRSDS
jgi:hypothetical protein